MADESETDSPEPTPNLPMVIEQPGKRLPPAKFDLPASFITQLIAEREHLDVQRKLRRGPAASAVGAYSQNARAMDKRMPAGFRHTHEV
jgi:hypothetical protein